MKLLLKKRVLKFPRNGLHEGYVFVGASTVGERSRLYTIRQLKRRIEKW